MYPFSVAFTCRLSDFHPRHSLAFNTVLICLSVMLFFSGIATAQTLLNPNVHADFSLASDTVCAKDPVFITNLSSGATTFLWSFSTGNPEEPPRDENFGNVVGVLIEPKYVTLVKSGNEFYSFITDAGNGMVVRNYHGNQLINHPLTTKDIIRIDSSDHRIRGIQVRNDNGIWYGFVVRENMLVRLTFGSSLANIPVASDVVSNGNLAWGDGLVICKEGTKWLGFC
ncbi:MAG: hypothetical protein NTW16_11255, partial [Bacteroidetes bacterium]|nr:hypothetical protein [Bacteroidota bacterium]